MIRFRVSDDGYITDTPIMFCDATNSNDVEMRASFMDIATPMSSTLRTR